MLCLRVSRLRIGTVICVKAPTGAGLPQFLDAIDHDNDA
jgi:hypothetical protein